MGDVIFWSGLACLVASLYFLVKKKERLDALFWGTVGMVMVVVGTMVSPGLHARATTAWKNAQYNVAAVRGVSPIDLDQTRETRAWFESLYLTQDWYHNVRNIEVRGGRIIIETGLLPHDAPTSVAIYQAILGKGFQGVTIKAYDGSVMIQKTWPGAATPAPGAAAPTTP